ncbi:MAG: prepilin peptidase [Candidatus Altiarchaeia archaeon]
MQFAILLAVVFLVLGSIEDLKTGEIPERISYGYIASALLVSAAAAIYAGNAYLFLNSLLMGICFFALGFLLFYLGQWGGGDVKLAGGIGCTLGFLAQLGFFHDGLFPYYATYFIDMICVALPYATVYGLLLGLKSPETWKEFGRYLRDKRLAAVLALSFAPSFVGLYMDLPSLALFYTLIPVMTLIALYLKAVELKALRDTIDVSKLREADVPAEDIVVGGQVLIKKTDIEGMTLEDVKKIQDLASHGKIPRKIVIKRGIKFAPVLLFALLSVLYAGNFIEMIIIALT